MTLIRELIAIPERVHQGDFVLKLSDGVQQADQTLRDYVVTPQLADAFRNALGFIQHAVASGQSKAAYLHGSFGSGKSHFMAVLNLLLAGHTGARSIPALADAVANTAWAEGKRFLMVPYHMIGARDMESAILGQYAEHVRRLHPEAPTPGFYRAEALFDNAASLRAQLGDAAFFTRLNAGSNASAGNSGGWGALDTGWDAERYEAARNEPPAGEERGRLIGDLIEQHFPAYREIASSGESFVDLDSGLAIMSRHARDLGYDAVILFLDELVLWLASHAANVDFVSREGTKLVKLVEATQADRPVPLVSFIARQRDLRELVGDHLPGAIGVQFTDVLRHWEARFHRITLEDRNLPAIAEKRVLRPANEAARQTLVAAFDELRLQRSVMDTLLTTEADRELFRKIYPFSPALVQTLIAVSAVLQRERTALKLMLQLLVDRRDDLQLGQLIPVGDLWDVIADGDEPFSEGMRLQFENAKKLYRQKLLPMLEVRHGLSLGKVAQGKADAAAGNNLHNDARLLKTLLLAALVPEVESLKALTGQRLAALNHGTFRSPIPGQEAQQVIRRLRDWSSEIGEIKVTDEQNPLVSIQITGVDLAPVLQAASVMDNPGNRRKKLRELLLEHLGLTDDGELFLSYETRWRNTARHVQILHENVRDLRDDQLKSQNNEVWTVVLGYPFDERGRTPNDDRACLDAYAGGNSRTLVWLPSFLSDKAQEELGRYVILDHILQGERFDQYATHLSAIDRAQARTLARNQRDALKARLRGTLAVAYGFAREPQDAVSHRLSPEDQFRSLDETLAPRPPVGADFKAAFDNLLDQLFTHQFPAHPVFETEIKPAVVRKVWTEVQKAVEAEDQREYIADTATRRLVRAIVNPLNLGQVGETHLLLQPTWKSHLAQQQAKAGAGPTPTVQQLRTWIDLPKPMGLPHELQNLVILTVAAQTNRRLDRNGGAFEADIDRLPDDVTLQEQPLPTEDRWRAATDRAARIFGLTSPGNCNATHIGRLVAQVRERVRKLRQDVSNLVDAITDRSSRYAPAEDGSTSERIQTARSAHAWLTGLADTHDDLALIDVLSTMPLATSDAAVARAMAEASNTTQALTQAKWALFDAVRGLADHRQAAGQGIASRLADVLRHDEHVVPLRTRLDELERDAARLLADSVAPTSPGPTPPLPGQTPPPSSPTGAEIVAAEEHSALDLKAAAEALDALKARLSDDPSLRLTLQWRLERPRSTQP